jgi:hypothetical protein
MLVRWVGLAFSHYYMERVLVVGVVGKTCLVVGIMKYDFVIWLLAFRNS